MEYKDLPTTREKAAEISSKHFFTGKPCRHGHISPRLTKCGKCTECLKARSQKWRDRHTPEDLKAYKHAEYERNRDRRLKRCREYYQENRDVIRERSKEIFRLNPERAEKARECIRQWRESEKGRDWVKKYWADNKDRLSAQRAAWGSANRGRIAALSRRYQARKLQATPPWLTDEHWDEIVAIYEESERLTDETGIDHHVDHIVPLQGKTVCGLHVPWNLRAIPATENISKSNRLDEALLSAVA